MEDKVNYSVVGAFVVVLGAVLVAAVLWLAAGIGGKKRYEPYQSIIQESVAGLNIDAPVKYLGVDVGKVSGIAIDPSNSQQVRLQFLIERGTPIKQDTEAVLKSEGLTGIAYVELSGGSPGSPALVPETEGAVPIIRSKPSLSARLESILTAVLSNVDRMSNNLSAVFDADNRIALKATLADAATVAHSLASKHEAISSAIANASQTARIMATATKKVGPTLDGITGSAKAVADLAAVASGAAAGAGRAADTFGLGVLQLTTQTLPEVDRLIGELNQLSASLRRLSEQTERNPSSLLFGAPIAPPDPGERL